VGCSSVTPTTLPVGGFSVIDPTATGGCLQVPATTASGAEHVAVLVATEGAEAPNGNSSSYSLNGGAAASAPAPASPAPRIGGFGTPGTAEQFHAMLRARERAISQDPATALFAASIGATPPIAAAPPVVGDKRTFQVCATTSCSSFVSVQATAKSVGNKVAIFLDDTVPANGYTQTDLDSVGTLFDTYMHPIDTTAFGHESDIDNNGVVVVLLTDRVNALTPNCNQSGSVVLGYFFGNDLTNNTGSNHGEVFYSLVPDPLSATCTIIKSFTRRVLGPTFIHEFQHMISFNQHVLLRSGSSEDTWLNEGLSHFAEELGARQIPDAWCVGGGTNACLSQFASGDLGNAYDYLNDVEGNFLIEPQSSTGTLPERGANWLMVRWLADHFATDTLLGTDFTRKLEFTNLLGSTNVAAQTGQSFATLVTEWQLANALGGDTTFTEPTGLLRYKSWNFNRVFAKNPTLFAQPYPLILDPVTPTSSYTHTGTLRAGSGRHLDLIQQPSQAAVNVLGTITSTATVLPRFGVVRKR